MQCEHDAEGVGDAAVELADAGAEDDGGGRGLCLPRVRGGIAGPQQLEPGGDSRGGLRWARRLLL